MNKRDPEVVRNYQQLIGACKYLTTFTGGDCSFAVNKCARFMVNPLQPRSYSHRCSQEDTALLEGDSNPGPGHNISVKLSSADASAGTTGLKVEPNQLTASADADHAGTDERRSAI